jgi:hypothetical protein
VERGVYFDAWFPRQHCYHPSLPPRRLRMVEELESYRATSLVWAALGGGSISLPYLEQEAFGPVSARDRFYGFLNDSEFIAECGRRGIKVFGIVFEVQGWEFPVELTEDEDEVLALNELRGVGKRGWMGLREFSQNRYPKLWKPFEHYFPGGLTNSDGERVADLLEECCSRDIHGNPCHALWVECPDREHYCYTMDRNNPVWREYLKAVIRIQIDAGVQGVQLDEAELPITSMQYGGCFCKDCMKGFREYLRSLPSDRLPAELDGVDLGAFHYGSWLLEQGYDFKHQQAQSPLFWHYLRFQRGAIVRYFSELADYARDYAKSTGRSVLVSGNFFNFFDHYYPLEPSVDVLITEMRNTRYRQPAWYRYVAGFAGDKPVIVVENPYGGVVPELIESLKHGRGYDLFRMSIYEAAALGVNMSLPYGSWMGSVIQDAFYAPDELCVETGSFLAENERLFSRRTFSEVGVVYSVESSFEQAPQADELADNRLNRSDAEGGPFWQVCRELCDAAQPYDVVMFPDGELRPDSLTAADLARYSTLVLPECRFVTDHQAALLEDFVAAGGSLLVAGRFGDNLDGERRTRLLERDSVAPVSTGGLLAALPNGPQVALSEGDDLVLLPQETEDGAAIHILRYGYDEAADEVPVLPSLRFSVRLPGDGSSIAVHCPSGAAIGTAQRQPDGRLEVHLQDVPLYTVVELAT